MATSSTSSSYGGSQSTSSSQEVHGHNVGSHDQNHSILSSILTPDVSHSTLQAWDNSTSAASTSYASISSLHPTPGTNGHVSDFDQMTLPLHQAKVCKIPAANDDAVPEWRYEMRREAQEIVPGLFVGPYQSSRLLEPLKALNLTHVVCVYDQREKAFVKPRFPEHFKYLALEVRDAADQNLIQIFPQVKRFIDEALSNSGRVLVHCGDGISRSPAIVTAYVMVTFDTTHEEAFSHVQSRRFCVSPNTNFQRQIEAYEDIHKASLAMANYSRQADAVVVPRRKRDDLLEDGTDGDDDDDEELKERNLHAQRKRRGSEEEEYHHYAGEQTMDTS